MSWQPTRRQVLALGAASAAAGLTGVPARAQSGVDSLKIGVVFPSRSGLSRIRTSIDDFIGDGARQGSLFAEQQIGDRAAQLGIDLTVLQANAPTPAAAIRAGERLVEFDGVDALLGGIGDGQLEALIPIAERAGIPLFNVGTLDGSFRNQNCSRNVFHLEASDAMYLDAMVMWSAARGHRRWFIIHEDNARGRDRQMTAVRAATRHGQGGEVVGAAAVVAEQPVYFGEIEEARRAGADALLVLLNATDQIAFFGQLNAAHFGAAVLPFPDPTSQTRDFILALREMTSGHTPVNRFQLWDPTLEADGAKEFNDVYLGRFSAVADPTAWSSFHAVKVLLETVVATGSRDFEAIVAHLEDPATEFDLIKGPGSSFRPWDHQLRQPVYAIEIDPDYEVEDALIGVQLESSLRVARVEQTLPFSGGAVDPIAWLDQLGDGPDQSACVI